MSLYDLVSGFKPTGDQPQAIAALCAGLDAGKKHQVLEGVTGSGKTFTMANVIAHAGKPVLVVSHNKTLAAQLYAELKTFLPNNAVSFFISYFDYYQPEAYLPRTDTYIEKDSAINEDIERLRLAATDNLLNRKDVVIVASVSCIYGLGSPEDYMSMLVQIERGQEVDRDAILSALVDIQYTRNEMEKAPGTFRVRGDTVDIFPSYNETGMRLTFFGDEVDAIQRIDPLTGKVEAALDGLNISPAKHFVTPYRKIKTAIAGIKEELEERVAWFEKNNKLLEAQRIRMRTEYDLELLQEIGFCSGIENYSRQITGRGEGERPYTLLDYFAGEFLTIIDESHASVPQIRGMFNGDLARKRTLVEHGFRLPSALDNRPLRFDEFEEVVGQIVFVTATPGPYEREKCPEVVHQVIRPTGIIEPEIEVRPLGTQIDDLMEEIRLRAEREERVLVTTLTKKTAEDLSIYLRDAGLRAKYLHSDIDALERVELLRSLRKREFDALIGINLLREGLDLPEVSLVAILDADKEGFLRSETSLIQTAGRAARNIGGKVILYADEITKSMQKLIDVCEARRKVQLQYNKDHNITPRSIVKEITEGLKYKLSGEKEPDLMMAAEGKSMSADELISELETEMQDAAKSLEYERAAMLRDQIMELRAMHAGGSGKAQKPGSLTYKKRGRGKKKR